MRSFLLIPLLLYPLTVGGANAEGVDDLTGRWRTARHGALVEIADCGDGTPCGTLSWVSEAISEGNTADINNRNQALRNRPLIGLPILWGFECIEAGCQNGRLYNPEDGKTFHAHLQLLSKAELRVRGCLGPLCRSQIWMREVASETKE
ncbi:hypothetical protein GCM10007094_13200 [Pseudovibrio japonicus]|uniref:DUF2147 domain-containing protein n=1 Tax=Pseudovibrio japonicus TaxID=366534 RepID=A0ABQ3EAJ9_9HYPH|nr:DUF2147 domain-containing protein [Pseudovibrio japonicus]GHB26328.1 hypothetical protein GCM10007094_13200 [Pseudovibrio japonicus]